MKHDFLCPAPKCDYVEKQGTGDCRGHELCPHYCQCDLIANARRDERGRFTTAYYSSDYHRGYCDGVASERKYRQYE